MRFPVPAVTVLAAALALAACQTTAPATADAAARQTSTTTVAANDNLNAVLWVQRSVEYQANTVAVFRAAADRLDAALAEPNWDALVPEEREQTTASAGLPPAVIMDIDETVLDNSPYQARLIANGQEYNDDTWAEWVAEKKARALPGVLDFARAAEARGVTILYLSNRAQHLQEATLANLRAEGLPVKHDGVFLGLGTEVEGCEQHGSEKRCRRLLAGREYRVLMQFGDQLGDFTEITANTPEGRAGLMQTYGDWFGERWWMLANPTYGSWEPALFDNAWNQPRETRRASKQQALDLADQ